MSDRQPDCPASGRGRHASRARDRHGPLQPGDLVQLTDPKGRHHTFTLVPGRVFHTHKGAIRTTTSSAGPRGSW